MNLFASSSTALANLAYLIGAAAVAVIGGFIVWLRHRQPKSVDANMATFRKGLSALAPDAGAPQPKSRRHAEPPRVRPAPIGLTHVRIEPGPAAGGQQPRPAPADEAGGPPTG